MRTLDLTPIYRSAIGFDRMSQLLDSAFEQQNQPSYPPYNVELTGENNYRITMAVAGFSKDELDIESSTNLLTISGHKTKSDDDKKYLYQGIAGRGFERKFQLADHVKVVNAKIEDGLLHIDLVREIPEAMRTKKIDITS